MNNTLLRKRYGNVVEGPMGFQMPEKTARIIESSSRTLPADFTYRRRAYSAKQEDVNADGRTEVSVITTDAVDRDGECVLSGGGDWNQYNKVVPFCHDYKALPAGFSQWVLPKSGQTKAQTQYPPAPEGWSGPWLPSAIWHFITQPVPTMGDKSIGFLPMNVRGATVEEKKLRPNLDSVPIIDKWLALEYSCVLIPCNQDAQLEEVIGKGVESGAITKEFANMVRQMAFNDTSKTVVPMSSPASKAAAEASNADSGNVVDTNVGAVVDPEKPPKPSSVKMMMPPHVKAAMKGMAEKIDPEHMHDDGVEDDPSMTIHGGMIGQDAEKVKALLADQPPMNCRLGKCKSIPMKSDDGEDVDGIGIQAGGKDLHDLHQKLLALPHNDPTAMDFAPHVKIATCKKDMVAGYDGMDGLQGLGMTCRSVKFIDGEGNGTDIPLTGKPKMKTLWPEGHDPDNDNDTDPIIRCPDCLELAKMSGNVDVPGIGTCDKYVCEKCDTQFIVPEQFHRLRDTISGDGTNQSNVDTPRSTGVPGKTKTAKKSLNAKTEARAMGITKANKVSDSVWDAPNGGDRKEADCLGQMMGDDVAPAEKFTDPIIQDGMLMRRAVANAASRESGNPVGAAASRIMTAIQEHDEKTVTPFIRPEVMERAKEKRLAELRLKIAAELVPVTVAVLDRRLGKV